VLLSLHLALHDARMRLGLLSIVHLPTQLHLCGIGVCGHLELHLGDGCCWVESLRASLGAVEDGVTSV